MNKEMQDEMTKTVLDGLRAQGFEDPQAELSRQCDVFWGRQAPKAIEDEVLTEMLEETSQ